MNIINKYFCLLSLVVRILFNLISIFFQYFCRIYLRFHHNKNICGICCDLCNGKCERFCVSLAEKSLNEPTDYIEMEDNKM